MTDSDLLKAILKRLDRIADAVAPRLQRARPSRDNWREIATAELHRHLREAGRVPTGEVLTTFVTKKTGYSPDLSAVTRLIQSRLDQVLR